MIPCQNCANLHKDFKLPTNLKSIHEVKTITVIEGSGTNLNELEVPSQSNDDTLLGSRENPSEDDTSDKNDEHLILKRSTLHMNHTRKHTAEPLINWREFDQVKHPIKREVAKNATKKLKRIKIRPVEAINVINNSTLEEEKRKATEILESIKSSIKSDQAGENTTEAIGKAKDLSGIEAQHKTLMTEAIIQKPNGRKVLLQDKAFSEAIRKNVRADDGLDRAFKTNVNFYDDLPNYSPQYNSHYNRDSSNYERPRNSFYEPKDTYNYKYSQEDDSYSSYKPHYDSYDTAYKFKTPHASYDNHYDKPYDGSHDDYDSFSKYKPRHKYKSKIPAVDTMVDVMPDHDAQYEYVPMEKDEYGNGKLKHQNPYKQQKYHGLDSDEDDHEGGGYGYSSFPQKSHYNKPYDYYSRPSNSYNSHDDGYRSPYKPKYKDEYPKYEKIPREYDYDHRYGSEESRTHHSRTKYGIKNTDKPLTLKVNLDENEEEGADFDYGSREGSTGRIAARVTKVPKTLEEYHRLHRTWEKRPSKPKTYTPGKGDQPIKKNRKPLQPKTKQSSRPFPPLRDSLEKPQSSYEFETPSSHVSMDFDTPRIPEYDEHSEAFRDTSAESEDSRESIRSSPIKISPEVDSVFNKFNHKDTFKRVTTERPYKITRLKGKPLYSEEDSVESTRDILRDKTPKFGQRDKEDLFYDSLKPHQGHTKYKGSLRGSTPRSDIFKELGLDFDNHSEGRYRPDKNGILAPKVGTASDELDNSGEKNIWNFHQ